MVFATRCGSSNDFLPTGTCTLPALSTRNSTLPALTSRTARAHVERHRPELGVRHEPARAQHLAEPAHLPHEVGRRDGGVEVHEAALDLLHQVLGPHQVGAGLAGLALLLALGEHRHPHRLADAVRQHDGSAHHLVGMLGIDPEPQRHVHRLVELGVGQLLEDAEGLLDGVRLLAVEEGLGRLQLLGRGCHLGSCACCLTVYCFKLFSCGGLDMAPALPRPRSIVFAGDRLLLQALQLRGPRHGPRTPP